MRRYTGEEKENALKLAEEIGAPKAAEQLGISYATLLDWRKKAGESNVPEPEVMEEMPAAQPEDKPPVSNDLPLELRVRLLEQENAQLKARLTQFAKAIHDLSPAEE